jgi:hypothetical protein
MRVRVNQHRQKAHAETGQTSVDCFVGDGDENGRGDGHDVKQSCAQKERDGAANEPANSFVLHDDAVAA